MDRGAWKATVHGVPKIHNKNWNDQTRLSNWACTSNSTPGYTTGKDENFNLKKDTRTSVFIAALFTTAKTWKKPNCGVCVCIHTHTHTQQNITQPHKKIMNGPRNYHTKSDKDKYHMISFMWDLKKWYKGTYLQNRPTDLGNKLVTAKGEIGGMDKLGI